MKKKHLSITSHILSIMAGIWFLLTGWIWAYGAALVISYPIALIGIISWYFGNWLDKKNKRTQPILLLYAFGLGISICGLYLYR